MWFFLLVITGLHILKSVLYFFSLKPPLALLHSDLSGCYFEFLSYLADVLCLGYTNSNTDISIFTSQLPHLTLCVVSQ